MAALGVVASLASEGLAAGQDLLGAVLPLGKAENSGKRVFSHWSQLCVFVAGGVALISAVALAVIGQYVITGIFVALFLVDVIAFYYLKKFVQLKDLVGITAELDLKAKALLQTQLALSQIKEQLNAGSANLIKQQKLSEMAFEEQQSRFALNAKVFSQTTADLQVLKKEKEDLFAKNRLLQAQLEESTHVISENLGHFLAIHSNLEQLDIKLLSDQTALKNFLKSIMGEDKRHEVVKEQLIEEVGKVISLKTALTLSVQAQIENLHKIGAESQQNLSELTKLELRFAKDMSEEKELQANMEETNKDVKATLVQGEVVMDKLIAALQSAIKPSNGV